MHWLKVTIPLVFWYGSIGLDLFLCLRMVISGAFRRYPVFLSFIAASAVELTVLAAMRNNSFYGNVWICSRALMLILEVAAVLEIFSTRTADYAGIGAFGRKLFGALFVVSVLVSGLTLPADLSRNGWAVAYQATAVANRGVHLCLAVFLSFTILFFARYGMPAPGNLRRHTTAMIVFLAATAAGYLPTTVLRLFWLTGLLIPAVSFLALAMWCRAFRRGDDVREPEPVTPEELAALLEAEEWNRRMLIWAESVKLRGLLGLK